MTDAIGHNSIAAEQLKALIERIERMEEEKATIATDIREIYAEAKGNGFNTKVMRQIVRLRAMDPDERREIEAIRDLYMHALGMTPMERIWDKDASGTADPAGVTEAGVPSPPASDLDLPDYLRREKASEAA